MKKKNVTYWACDFETTVWGEELENQLRKKQDCTEVWSAADVALYDNSETVTITHSIRDFLNRFLTMGGNNILYFHNLSFDGSFIVDFLLKENWKWVHCKDKEMRSKTFQTCISDLGSWYWIKLKWNKNFIEIRNSLKLMPSSLNNIAKSFKTKHKKLEMVYTGMRYAYCNITEEEKKYIENDVLVLKEALEMMFDEGHQKLTIGSCCLSEFKAGYDLKDYKRLFPDLREDYLDEDVTGVWNIWDYVHKSYHGGWCYLNPKFAHIVVGEGLVYDVNSLYPSMMHSMSGNKYPFGHGEYHKGAPPIDLVKADNKYYFIRFTCRFRVKENAFPWVHIRHSALYKSNENLYTSDVRYKGQYYRYYRDADGNICDTKVTLTMTCTDWELFNDTYEIYDLEIHDYVWFYARDGFFDAYIDKYAEMKKNSKGFSRQLAKLFLNNLYGKFAMSDNSSYKEPYLDENGVVRFILHEEHEKGVGYIPIGSAITSYAMNFTIRHALANKERFCYADTDSIHLIGLEDAEMVIEHPTNFCCWGCEATFDFAYYERQKTYAEHIVAENRESVDTPYLDIKACGMSKSAKEQFIAENRDIKELTTDLELYNCNLKSERVKGGIVLRNKTFKMHQQKDKKVTI